LRSYLAADAGVSALVASRIYPVALDVTAPRPALVYQRMPRSPHDQTLTASLGTSLATFHITAFADDYADADALAEAVRQAMQAFSGTMGATHVDSAVLADDYDEYFDPVDGSSRGTYAVISEFRIRYRESIAAN
jgi:deferrochelatase/peroxidase EfeB